MASANTIGMFGSNIAPGKMLRISPPAPSAVDVRMPTSHGLAAPTFHGVGPRSVPASLLHEETYTLAGLSSFAKLQPQGAGSSQGLFGDVVGGVEGFIGHLSTDVVTTALGMPQGLLYLANHPIAGAEGMVKATWADWSPLFHGDVGTFAHNFYEHPLAPILDVLGFASFGAGTAARGLAAAGKLGEVADAASAVDHAAALADTTKAAKAAYQAARFANPAAKVSRAAEAGRVAAEVGIKTTGVASKTWMTLQRLGAPTAWAAKSYGLIAKELGFEGEDLASFVDAAIKADSNITKVTETAGKLTRYDKISDNPWTRVRQRNLSKLGNAAAASQAGQMLHVDKFIGDQAMLKRFVHQTAGTQAAIMQNTVAKTIKGIADAGEVLSGKMKAGEIFQLIHHGTEADAKLGTAGTAGLHVALHSAATDIPAATATASTLEHLLKSVVQGGDGHRLLLNPSSELAIKGMTKIKDLFNEAEASGVPGAVDDAWKKVLAPQGSRPSLYMEAVSTGSVDDIAHAIQNADGALQAIPSEVLGAAGKEAFNAGSVLKMMYQNPTRIWRYMLLGVAPRYFVNNFIGNGLMLMVATDPVTMMRSMYAHSRAIREETKVFEADNAKIIAEAIRRRGAIGGKGAEKVVARRRALRDIAGTDWKARHYAAEYGMGGENMRVDVAETKGKLDQQFNDAINALNRGSKTSLHTAVHKYADMPFRNAALQYSMYRMPQYQALYAAERVAGKSHWEASNLAAEAASASPMVRQLVREQVQHMLGQYHTFTSAEKAVKAIIPFYSWDRAIVKNTKYLITSAPYKVAVGAAISTMGATHRDAVLAQVPDFLQANLPVKDIPFVGGAVAAIMGQAGGRENTLNAQNLNPWGSVGDIAAAAGSFMGTPGSHNPGETMGAQLNPMFQGLVQALTGKNLMTGATDKSAGSSAPFFLRPFAEAMGTTPEAIMGSDVLGLQKPSVSKSGYATLYQEGLLKDLSAFMGVPVKQVDPAAIQYLYDQQNKIKKPSTHKPPQIPGL